MTKLPRMKALRNSMIKVPHIPTHMTGFSSLQMAYGVALLCIFVDQMGIQFTAPGLVPFSTYLGLTIEQVGNLYTAQFAGILLSNTVMPAVSDKRGRSIVVYISMAGSCIAYITQGLASAPFAQGYEYEVLVAGKVLSGLFGGTFPVMLAYIADLSIPDLILLRQRTLAAVAMNFCMPVVLAPIGGALSTLGLVLPFYRPLLKRKEFPLHLKSRVKITKHHRQNPIKMHVGCGVIHFCCALELAFFSLVQSLWEI